ncbi:MAG: NADH-quinone oxidoreductase subunit L [Verrucomicrobiota bacterium]
MAPYLLHWILFLPLVAAACSALFLRRQGAIAAWFSTATAFTIAGLALKVLLTGGDITWHIELAKFGDISLGFGYLLDANARLMLFVVSFVAAWIHLFSVGYMKEDAARGRFFAGLSIFMFSILGIVVADNLLMTFIFWELVGFSSYMLIAHYFDKDYAAAASKKAFIVNRVGDLGFILGIAMCLSLYGTLDFAALKDHAAAAKTIPVAVGALLMCGFLGKSAQFPLHVWLTDAMAGPTPVSALIHAATMVAAGVYFMARVSFLLAPEVLQFIAISGAGMAALAGLCALAQTDIKKSLAYSTLAHLGIMGCALGLGRPDLAVLHMAMHAFFKATLFLGAGSVIHGCHHEQDMLKMGGLLKKMPFTAATFIAATLSNCAVPFFAGWYSKDAIIEAAYEHNFAIFAFLAIAALATCLYSGRMIRLVFLGEANSEAAEHAHESPWTMTLPIIVLGLVYSIAGGFLAHSLIPASALGVVAKPLEEMAFHLTAPATLVGLLALLLGFGGALKFYGITRGKDALQVVSPRTYHLLEHRWMDGLYRWYIDSIQRRVAEFIAFLDLLLINGVAVRWIAGGVPAVLGYFTGRSFHRGQTRGYALWIVLGTLFLAWFLIAR